MARQPFCAMGLHSEVATIIFGLLVMRVDPGDPHLYLDSSTISAEDIAFEIIPKNSFGCVVWLQSVFQAPSLQIEKMLMVSDLRQLLASMQQSREQASGMVCARRSTT
eukprot:4229838-Amphidinium_carterae.3